MCFFVDGGKVRAAAATQQQLEQSQRTFCRSNGGCGLRRIEYRHREMRANGCASLLCVGEECARVRVRAQSLLPRKSTRILLLVHAIMPTAPHPSAIDAKEYGSYVSHTPTFQPRVLCCRLLEAGPLVSSLAALVASAPDLVERKRRFWFRGTGPAVGR